MQNPRKKTYQQKLAGPNNGNTHSPSPENGSAAFGDPAFHSNKRLPIHRWAPWIAGFSKDFVDSVLDCRSGTEALVLDPFAGVGTTNIQAVLNGSSTVGFEINPYAAFVCTTKVNSFKADSERLELTIEAFDAFYRERLRGRVSPLNSPPLGFTTRRPFYSDRVLRKVLTLLDFIDTIDDSVIRDLFRLAFSSTMVTYSNYSYEPSLSTRSSSGKSDIEDYPVGELVTSRLRMMLEDILWYQRKVSLTTPPEIRIVNDSFFNHRQYLEPGSVDVVVTSPPYLNNYHYNRNTRPQMYWLGLVSEPKDTLHLEELNFGNFWQTVRDRDRIDLNFSLPNSDMSEVIETIRKKNPERGVYGGEGWANYACSYLNDCHRFCSALAIVLKAGASSMVVVGNSIIQGTMVPIDRYLGEIGELAGLELVRIEIPRSKRVGNSIIRSSVRVGKTSSRNRLYEAVVEFKKP